MRRLSNWWEKTLESVEGDVDEQLFSQGVSLKTLTNGGDPIQPSSFPRGNPALIYFLNNVDGLTWNLFIY